MSTNPRQVDYKFFSVRTTFHSSYTFIVIELLHCILDRSMIHLLDTLF